MIAFKVKLLQKMMDVGSYSMNAQLKVGYVGCGVMGRVFLKAAQTIASIRSVAVADQMEAAARQVAAEFGIDQVYTSAAAMYEHADVDAVVLALPAKPRMELAIQAFRAGKHVLTEKPVSRNAEEVHELLREQGDLIAGCTSSRFRLLDSAVVVADALAQGMLGPLRILRSRWHTSAKPKPEKLPPLWRFSKEVNGGGNMANLGSYLLDYFLGVNGWRLQPESIFARNWRIPEQFADYVPQGSDGESLTSALITFKDGPVMTLEQGEHYISKPVGDWEMIGTDGTLTFSLVPANSRVVLRQFVAGQVIERVLWEGHESFTTVHERVLADFAASVLNNRQPYTNLEQALIVRKLIDGIYLSEKLKRSIHFTELDQVQSS